LVSTGPSRCHQPRVWDLSYSNVERSGLKRRIHRSVKVHVDAGEELFEPSPSPSYAIPGPDVDLQGKDPRQSWNASSLAFLGDSVFELYARRRCFLPPKSAAKYRDAVIQLVRAEAQAVACGKLSESGMLTEEEADVLRWGKNAPGTLPKRLERAVYRDATGLEALVGWLFASGRHERLNEIMQSLEML